MADYNWADPLFFTDQLTEDERIIMDAARNFAQDRLQTRVQKAFREEHFDREIMNEMGELGMLGATVPEQYGPAGRHPVPQFQM